jgi:pimeloyl-ACP methyl ester carboxylesterase
MPKIKVNGLMLNYEQQGAGEPLILLPFLTADNACYAFQVAEYAKHFTCISIDLRGTGASDPAPGSYTMEDVADDVAGLVDAIGIGKAHVSGLSFGAAVGMWLAAKHPDKVRSLSLHSGWPKTDPFLAAVVTSWQVMAKGYGNVPDLVIHGIFPWCFTPELYGSKLDYIQGLGDFVRSRPVQTLESFSQQSKAVIGHDVEGRLGSIKAPTQITFGRHDLITSIRFADRMVEGIRGSELAVFENSGHAPIYDSVEEFNQKTLAFLRRNSD